MASTAIVRQASLDRPGVRFEDIVAPARFALVRWANGWRMAGERALGDRVMRQAAAARTPEALHAAMTQARALQLRFDRPILPRVAAAAARVPPPPGAPAAAGPSEWYEPRGERARGLVFHVHGGAFIAGRSPRIVKLVARFGAAAGASVFAPSYRLAPEHPCPAAVEDVRAAWAWLRRERPEERVVALAESAGCAILLAALQAERDAGGRLPDAVVLLSPFVDLTLQSLSVITASLTGNASFSMASMALAARFYRGGLAANDPRVSPLFGDFHGLPPMLIHTSRGDILHDDALGIADRMRQAGGDLSVRVWEAETHVWERMNGPEARRSIKLAAGFIERHLTAIL